MSQANMKVLKVVVNDAFIKDLMHSNDLTTYLEDVAQDLVTEIERVSPTESGWKARVHRRPKRTTAVAYTRDPNLRFREALSGVIRRMVRDKQVYGPIKVRKTNSGFQPAFERKL